MAAIAQDVFAVHFTSVASKGTIFVIGHFISDHSGSLGDDIIAACIFVLYWMEFVG